MDQREIYFKFEKVLQKDRIGKYPKSSISFAFEICPLLKDVGPKEIVDPNNFYYCIGGDNIFEVRDSNFKLLKEMHVPGYWFYTLLPLPTRNTCIYVDDYCLEALNLDSFECEQIGNSPEYQTSDQQSNDLISLSDDKIAFIQYRDQNNVRILDLNEKKLSGLFRFEKRGTVLCGYKNLLIVGFSGGNEIEIVNFEDRKKPRKKIIITNPNQEEDYTGTNCIHVIEKDRILITSSYLGKIFILKRFLEKNNNKMVQVVFPSEQPKEFGLRLGYTTTSIQSFENYFIFTEWNCGVIYSSHIFNDDERNFLFSKDAIPCYPVPGFRKKKSKEDLKKEKKEEEEAKKKIENENIERRKRGLFEKRFIKEKPDSFRSLRWLPFSEKKYLVAMTRNTGFVLFKNLKYSEKNFLQKQDLEERISYLGELENLKKYIFKVKLFSKTLYFYRVIN